MKKYPICDICNKEVISPLKLKRHFLCMVLKREYKKLDLDTKDFKFTNRDS